MTASTLTQQIACAPDTGISGFSGPHGTLIRFDTSKAEARAALDLAMRRMGPEGRELKQAEAGVRMALSQRRRGRLGYGSKTVARTVLRGAIKRLRLARKALEPVTIPVLEPITATIRQLDPAIWGQAIEAAE